MKVRFTAEVLGDASAYEFLDQIVSFFRMGRHRWVIENAAAIEGSQWIASEPHSRATLRNQEALYKATTAAAYPRGDRSTHHPERCHTIEISVGGQHGLAPADAYRALAEPAYLVVENSGSDGLFIRAMIHAYERDALLDALTERWLELVHAGGKGEVGKKLVELVSLAPGPKRVQALTDSDRLYPGHSSDTVKKMTAVASEIEKKTGHRITIHVLHKRDAENYLLLTALARSRHRKAYQAFRDRLTDAQQDHFDMKKGFKRVRHTDAKGRTRETAVVPTEQQSLYASLPANVLDALAGGFGDGVWAYSPGARRLQAGYERISADKLSRCAGTRTGFPRYTRTSPERISRRAAPVSQGRFRPYWI